MTGDYNTDDEVYVGTLPRWMVRQMRSDARHAKRTARTREGEKESEMIERALETVLKRDEQRSIPDEHLQFERIRIRIALEDSEVAGGQPIHMNYEGVRDQLISCDRRETEDLLESIVRQQFREIVAEWNRLRDGSDP